MCCCFVFLLVFLRLIGFVCFVVDCVAFVVFDAFVVDLMWSALLVCLCCVVLHVLLMCVVLHCSVLSCLILFCFEVLLLLMLDVASVFVDRLCLYVPRRFVLRCVVLY